MTAHHYDVVVIGAGVAGASLCLQLARQGVRVALVEKGTVGAGGATALSGGIVRVHDPDPFLSSLSAAGRNLLLNWSKLGVEGPSPYTKSGVYWLKSDQPGRSIATDTRVGRVADFPRLNFLRERSDPLHVLYEPDSGYVDARRLCASLVQSAINLGVDVYENTHVVGYEVSTSGEVTVRTHSGSFTAHKVALCAGAGFVQMTRMEGAYVRSIPLVTVRANSVRLETPIIDETASTYMRPLRSGVFFCGSQKWSVPGEEFDRKAVANDALKRLRLVLGRNVDIEVINVDQKYDAYSHDLRPVIRFIDGKSVLFLGCLSGRGVKYSLAVGVLAARKLIQSMSGHYQESVWDDCIGDELPMLVTQANSDEMVDA
jgi:glycine/D-amino acid oxidase-like deaminating enzyme|tara:strand:+ start:47371 stop:48486 length:1116 start_codon:yes stop_codon:yes gene_type:complete